MALIYASAVNKRMHQLQKKRSVDVPSQHHEITMTTSFNLQNQQKNVVKKRLQKGENMHMVLERTSSMSGTRIKSAPPLRNGIAHQHSCGNPSNLANATTDGCKNGGGGGAVAMKQSLRKMMTVDGGDDGYGSFVGEKREEHTAKRATSTPRRHLRKVSTTSTSPREEKEADGAVRQRKKQQKSSKDSTPTTSESEVTNNSKGDAVPQHGINGTIGGHRRRSVSVDETAFRGRAGTGTSQEGGGSPKSARKQSALQKMRERLNKWKLSG